MARRASRLNSSVGAVVELAPPIGTVFEDKQPLPEGVTSHQVRPTLDMNPPQLFPGSESTTPRTIWGLGGHIFTFMTGDGVGAAVDAVVAAYKGQTVYKANPHS